DVGFECAAWLQVVFGHINLWSRYCMSPTDPSLFSGRRSKSERTSVESICNFDDVCNYDDTLPLPDEVEREFIAHAGNDVSDWFAKHDIAAAPIGKIIQYWSIWNPGAGRYRFMIYGPDHV